MPVVFDDGPDLLGQPVLTKGGVGRHQQGGRSALVCIGPRRNGEKHPDAAIGLDSKGVRDRDLEAMPFQDVPDGVAEAAALGNVRDPQHDGRVFLLEDFQADFATQPHLGDDVHFSLLGDSRQFKPPITKRPIIAAARIDAHIGRPSRSPITNVTWETRPQQK